MSQQMNRQIVLASRPSGKPESANFRLDETAIPVPEDGQVLCKTIYLSLDPYMRGRMNAGKSYAPPVEIDEVMGAGTVGQVIESNNSKFNAGDFVFGYGGWQEFWVQNGTELKKVDPQLAPISTATGVLGMPGVTAYTGLLNIGKPKKGETVVVAAASGAVGSVVGQIARIKGARAVGIAGSAEKCKYVTEELGFDACVNHNSPEFAEALKAACPDGIDVYFENVGGKVFETVSPLFNDFARIPVCGIISAYNATELPPGPNLTPLLMRDILVKRLTFRGFIVWDFASQENEALSELANWIKDGKLHYREDIVDGLENAPEAFIGLLEGKNFG
ncbi:MAG: NADP-dependent oxidoreductase, partial [Deltaproteobacteria bacterium]|nr:NADP-dependent oxidoreductase [Deltaproteobacteria bacterium]